MSISERIGTVLVFVAIGPLVGALAVFVLSFGASLFGHSGLPWFPLEALALLVMFGYVFGAGPAALAGLMYAIAPPRLKLVIVSPIVGVVATWVFYQIVGRVWLGSLYTIDNQILLLGAGAVAATTCACVVRAGTRRTSIAQISGHPSDDQG